MVKKREQGTTNPSGFTLIELSFAVLFIALLLLTIALITTQIVGAYRKGVSLKAVNQVGRELVEDLRTSLTNSPSTSKADVLCSGTYNDSNCKSAANPAYQVFYNAFNFSGTVVTKEGNNDTAISGPQLYGVFCTGEFSYIWNTGYVFSDDYTDSSGGSLSGMGITVKITTPGNDYDNKPHLLRVRDSARAVCKPLAYNTLGNTEDITLNGVTDPIELISSSKVESSKSKTDAPLALYDLYIAPPTSALGLDNGHLFFTGSFILGTTSGGVNIKTAGNNCKPPAGTTQTTSNFNYCAVNKFNFAVQSTQAK